MSDWTLVDCTPMVTDVEDLPSFSVESEEQLRAELESYRNRVLAPIIHLISPDGAILHMGISKTLSGVQWKKGQQLRIAMADRQYSESGMDFRFQGSNSGFRQRNLIPVEKTIDAALHYFRTGELPDWLQWAEWNPKARRMEVPKPERNGVPVVPPQQELPDTIVHRFCPNCSAVLTPPKEADSEQVCAHCGASMRVKREK